MIWTCLCLCAYYLAIYRVALFETDSGRDLAIVATIQLVSKPPVAVELSQRLRADSKGYHDAGQVAMEAEFLGSNVCVICRSAGERALCSKLSVADLGAPIAQLPNGVEKHGETNKRLALSSGLVHWRREVGSTDPIKYQCSFSGRNYSAL